MPRYRVRMEFEIDTDDREQAVELVETYLHYGLQDFSLDHKVTGTEEIK